MKETEQVSIGGYAFILEKDAAAILGAYLDKLESHYLPQEGGREIMEGIEERLAELLIDRCPAGMVATESHIRSIIAIIGEPEKIEADEPASAPTVEPKRKLFRDVENKRLGGVCSGLATYLKIDVAWIRLLFAVLAAVIFFGGVESGVWCLTVPFLYCILWVAMPAARTAQDRWAMKGESGTVDEISRNVRSGIQEMGQTAGEVVHSSFFQRFGKFLLIAIGIILLITGTSGLASVSVLSLKGQQLFGPQIAGLMEEISQEAPVVMDLLSTPWVVVLAALAIILPLVGILYGGIQLIFGFKSPSWRPGLVIFILWLIIVIVLLVLLIAAAASTELNLSII